MSRHKTFPPILCAAICCACCTSGALALDDPNGNYSSLVLSYRNMTFADPVCVATECHTGVAGPAAVFSRQIAPNLAWGLSGSYLQSNGNVSSLKSSSGSVFLLAVAGIGPATDVGITVAALRYSTEICTVNPGLCTLNDDSGRDIGAFWTLFLSDVLSMSLNYDSASYQYSANQSNAGLSMVAVLAEHHRLSFAANKTLERSGRPLSNGIEYGFGYSYLF